MVYFYLLYVKSDLKNLNSIFLANINGETNSTNGTSSSLSSISSLTSMTTTSKIRNKLFFCTKLDFF